MSDYTEFTIGGYNSLRDIEGSIQEKEAGGFKFKQNRVVNSTNVVMFEKMPYPERPKPDIVFRCLVSCDHVPRRSWPLFRAKSMLNELIAGFPGPRVSPQIEAMEQSRA